MWSEPISSLLKRYRTSYPELRKICARMNVPIPKSSRWIRMRLGKDPGPITPLEPYAGEQGLTLTLVSDDPESNQRNLTPIDIRQREIESDPKVNLAIPEKLIFPDKIIQKAQKGFAERLKDNYSETLKRPGWEDQFDCYASKGNIDRLLKIMDTFIKALRARGHSLEVSNRETNVIIQGQKIKISIIESSLRTTVNDGTWKREVKTPTGRLAFRMKKNYNLKQFVDGKKTVEQQLSRILAELELHGNDLRLERIELEKQWAIEEEKEQIRKAAQERRTKELKKFRDFMRLAHRSNQTEILRRYVDRVEANAGNSPTPELSDWIAWARAKADWMDPIVEAEDTLLKNIDQDSLLRKEESSYFP